MLYGSNAMGEIESIITTKTQYDGLRHKGGGAGTFNGESVYSVFAEQYKVERM